MKEVLDHQLSKIEKSNILKELKLEKKKYFVVSTHREENVDNKENLLRILSILNELTLKYGLPVIVSTHPRTRKRIEELTTTHQSLITNHQSLINNPQIHFLKPFGFSDYVHLQQHAMCTLSDSGTISEESAILSFPAISLRNSMERPEAQDAGTITLTGFDKDRVLNCIETVMEEHKQRKYINNVADYSITDTSWRVLKLIQGLAGLSNKWSGIA
jgi:UDP-N-acetylglucosamine 2-epimerase (non-hydrolysing)